MKDIGKRLHALVEQILEIKVVKVLVGKKKKPKDNDNELIFHIDI